jgi:tetratricopeptide (TPR) repeat protein
LAAENEEKARSGEGEGETKPEAAAGTDAEARDAASTETSDAAGEPPSVAEAEDEGDDDEGDEDEGDDDASAEDEARGVAAAPEPGKPGKEKAPPSAGARLAAQKAAKAARKAAKRGKTNVVDSAVAKRAAVASEWATTNRRTVYVVLGALALAIGGFTIWKMIESSRAEEASAALQDAVETANAPIRAAGDAPAEEDEELETYPTIRARAEKALREYRTVVSNYGGTDAAVWARLGQAAALYDLERWADSRQAFEKAMQEGGDDPSVTWRALEGIGFTYEAEEKWPEALQRYQELSRTGGRAFRDVAEYHLARMYLAQGDDVRAKETLRTLVERLQGRATEGDESEDATQLQYTLTQAEARLAELDPSAVPRRGGAGGMGGMGGMGGPGGPESLTQEQIEELIRNMQKKMGNKAPPGGGGGGPPPGGGGE